MLVERHQPAEGARRALAAEEEGGGAVAVHLLGHDERRGRALCAQFLRRLAERHDACLRDGVGEEHVVHAQRIDVRLREGDEVRGHDDGALVQHLEERVLAVGAGFAPDDGAGVPRSGRAVELHVLAVGFHLQLLQVRSEAVEVLAVREHGMRAETHQRGVPDLEEAHQDRQVPLGGRFEEVAVHLVEAGQHLAERRGADGEHGAQADGAVHGVAAADPVPEDEHVGGVDAELRDQVRRGGNGHEMPGHALLVAAEGRQAPCTRGAGVGHGLLRGERLAGDDEERLRGIEVCGLPREVAGIDVRDEAEHEARRREVAQRIVGHGGAEIAAADPDVDDVSDGLAGVALPLAGADAVGEGGHAVEHLMDLRHDVDAVGADHGAARGAERHVEDGAVLGDVDVLAREHPGASGGEGRLAQERQQVAHHRRVHALLAEIHVDLVRLGRERAGSARVRGEQVAQVRRPDPRGVRGEGAEGGEFVQCGCGGHGGK